MATLPTTPPLPGTTLVNLLNTKLDTLAPIASPTFTGTPLVPATPTTPLQISPKEYVDDVRDDLNVAVALKAPIADPVFTGTVTLPGAPSLPLHSATKAYVDAVQAGIHATTEVVAATTANITLSAPQTIDGIAVTAGQRVLVKNQTIAGQNGIYVVAAGAWTRATDLDVWSEVNGTYTLVRSGTVNALTGWVAQGVTSGVIGTDVITWIQFNAVPSVSSGQLVYETRTALMAAGVPGSINWVQTLGYAAVGDLGGATYKRVGSMPTHPARIQSGDGAWWEIRNTTLLPEMLGAIGNGTTDDSTAIDNWHLACSALRRLGKATASATYRITTQLAFTYSNLDIDWNGATVSVVSATSSVGAFLFYGDHVSYATTTISTNIAKNDIFAVLSSATGVLNGRHILIHGNYVDGNQSHLTRIVSSSTVTVEMETPQPFSLLTSDPQSVEIVGLMSNIKVRNLIIDGTGMTGTSNNAISIEGFDDSCQLDNIKIKNFTGFNNGGIIYLYCYRMRVRDVASDNTGSAGVSGSGTYHSSSCYFSNCTSQNDAGFGMGLQGGAYNTCMNPRVESSHGRGFKLNASVRNTINTGFIQIDDSSGVGLAVTLRSQENIFIGLHIHTFTASQAQAIWFSDSANTDNIFIGCKVSGATTSPVAVFTTDTGNKFYSCSIDNPRIIANLGGAEFFGINGETWGYDNTGAMGPSIRTIRYSASPATGDYLAARTNNGYNSAGTQITYTWDISQIVTTTAGNEHGSRVMAVTYNGAYKEVLIVNGTEVRPVTTASAISLGNAASQWSNVYVSGGYRVGANQVVGARDTGWAPMTGTANKATVYATGTITLVQLAERVKALQDMLANVHGLTGT